MNKEQKAQSIIGPLGAIISHSKSGYIEIFNRGLR